MRYEDYRDRIATELMQSPQGATWAQLKRRLKLSYKVPCPEWSRRLEKEIGLKRVAGETRAYVWKLKRSINQSI